jgi:hypothetical protein
MSVASTLNNPHRNVWVSKMSLVEMKNNFTLFVNLHHNFFVFKVYKFFNDNGKDEVILDDTSVDSNAMDVS